VKLSHQHSRQAARVGRCLLHYYAVHSEFASAVAQQLQLQQWYSNRNAKLSKSNNQPVIIVPTEGKTWHCEDNSAASKKGQQEEHRQLHRQAVRSQQQSKSKDEVETRMTCNKNSERLLQQDVFKNHGAASS